MSIDLELTWGFLLFILYIYDNVYEINNECTYSNSLDFYLIHQSI